MKLTAAQKKFFEWLRDGRRSAWRGRWPGIKFTQRLKSLGLADDKLEITEAGRTAIASAEGKK